MLIQRMRELPLLKSIPKLISVDTETENKSGGIEGYSFSYLSKNKKLKGYYVPINHLFEEDERYVNVNFNDGVKYLKQLVKGRRVVFHNAQFDLTILEEECGIKIPNKMIEDTLLIHWLLDTERLHGLKPIMRNEYKQNVITYDEAKAQSFSEFAKYGSNDAVYTLWLFYKIYPEIKKLKNTFNLYRNVEIPNIRPLQDINYKKNFICIDQKLMKSYYNLIHTEQGAIQDILTEKLGDINPRSTKQLAEKLIEFGYDIPRKPPTQRMIIKAKLKGEEAVGNYSLDAGQFYKIHKKQGGLILSAILYNRKIEKVENTYVRPIYESLQMIKKGVYVLSGYDIMHTGTRTGRYSGHNPNLQNQPRDKIIMKQLLFNELKNYKIIKHRMKYIDDKDFNQLLKNLKDNKNVEKLINKYSIDIRKIFIPMPGRKFIGADYSQLELRMIAHLSNDKLMCEKFKAGADIHQETADIISTRVNRLITRQDAKPLNFGLIYGLFWTSFAETTGMPQKEAKEVWKTYFELFAGVTKFINVIQKSARESHYVQTLLGRRRNMNTVGINEWGNSKKDFIKRKNAENSSISTVVSGSASDLIKIAMNEIYYKYKKYLDIKLQIHDELLIEVDSDKAEKMLSKVRLIMENAIKLRVPVLVDAKIGNSWRDVH